MVIIDTTVWIDYLRGFETPQTEWLESHLNQQLLGLTDLTLCELLQGVPNERQVEALQGELSRFEVLPTGGVELAIAAARNYRALRTRGITVRKTIDGLIASFCLLNEHNLLHNDRDFDPFERELGLRVIHP